MKSRARLRTGSLDGHDLKRLFAAATLYLERNVEAINALNVFPVPDGDTGTNMLLTMQAVNQEVANISSGHAGAVAASMAKGALLGARGNSGVILSQFFAGLAQGLGDKKSFSAATLVEALDLASSAAYKAVSKPVEGTMLTVIREAAQGAKERHASDHADVLAIWEAARDAAEKALARTPTLLPVLREAGVVDAGGQGLLVIMEGALCALRGADIESLPLITTGTLEDGGKARVSESFLHATREEQYGFCVQLLVEGSNLDIGDIRTSISGMANSTVVVGDASVVKVHTHALEPQAIIKYAESLGRVQQVKIDNIDEQHQEFMAAHQEPQAEVPQGVIVVSYRGDLERVFRNLGALSVVFGGQTMNPSTQEMMKAVEHVLAQQTILLPNNPNVIPAARQAIALCKKPLRVVPSKTIPQGIAALLAFNPDQDLDTNVVAMQSALDTVRTAEITVAVRSAKIKGISISKGQSIGFLEDELAAVGDSPTDVAKQILDRAGVAAGNLITLYWGADTQPEEVEILVSWIRHKFPDVEVEAVHGGQPHYRYIVSIE